MIIVPAVLRESYEDIVRDVEAIKNVTSYIQIDITDGDFVISTSWPFNSSNGIKNLNKLNELNVDFELDLMVEKPEKILEHFLNTKAKRIILHLSSTKQMNECIYLIKKSNKEVSIAVSINDLVEDVEQYIDLIDGVQCMGIANIGKQGEPYDSRVEKMVVDIKDIKSDIKISIDGAQSKETIPRLKEIGVSQFCVGSVIFTGDAENNYIELNNLII